MREYRDQFYSEGLATTFYVKPIKFLEKRIHNKKILKVISTFFKIVYTLLIIAFALLAFYKRLPI